MSPDETGVAGVSGPGRGVLSDLRIRLLGPNDEWPLATLFEANDVPAVTRWFGPFPLSLETARALCRHRGRDLYWGVWIGSAMVGFAMVRRWDEHFPHPTYGCLVDLRRQGQGIGTTATELVLRELERREVAELRSRVHDDNRRSLRMHATAGFEELVRETGRVVLVARPGSRRCA